MMYSYASGGGLFSTSENQVRVYYSGLELTTSVCGGEAFLYLRSAGTVRADNITDNSWLKLTVLLNRGELIYCTVYYHTLGVQVRADNNGLMLVLHLSSMMITCVWWGALFLEQDTL
jgi:hypothetical protein